MINNLDSEEYQMTLIFIWDNNPVPNVAESGSSCLRIKVGREALAYVNERFSDGVPSVPEVLSAMEKIPGTQNFVWEAFDYVDLTSCELEIIFRQWDERVNDPEHYDLFSPRLLTINARLPDGGDNFITTEPNGEPSEADPVEPVDQPSDT